MNLIQRNIIVTKMAVEFAKFKDAMADGQLDIEWSMSNLALNGSVLSVDVTAKTEVGVAIKNTVKLDLKEIGQDLLSSIVMAIAAKVSEKIGEWEA